MASSKTGPKQILRERWKTEKDTGKTGREREGGKGTATLLFFFSASRVIVFVLLFFFPVTLFFFLFSRTNLSFVPFSFFPSLTFLQGKSD